MELKVKRKSGYVKINSTEIEGYINENLLSVPGISSVGKYSTIDKLLSFFNEYRNKEIKIYPLNNNEVSIECHVYMNKDINFKEVSITAQEIVKFAVEKKYGFNVVSVDIIVEGLK